MTHQSSITSLVYNVPYAKQLGVQPYYYRYRSCNANFPNRTQTSVGGFTPADQYQKLKIIQNTVRIYGSLYTANLAPLSAYKKPISNPDEGFYGVCWNQMSDRPVPSVQRATIPTGFATSMNRRHTSVTSSKPGSQTPGGIGCDIKHNSYDRYLNRLKGKGPLRRGIIPPNYGKPIVFNPAFPIFGGKTTKTNIIDNCDCPISNSNFNQNIKIYDNPLWEEYPLSTTSFQVGDKVYAIQKGTKTYSKSIIKSIEFDDIYTIQFDNGSIQTANINELLIYYPCECKIENKVINFPTGFYMENSSALGIDCPK